MQSLYDKKRNKEYVENISEVFVAFMSTFSSCITTRPLAHYYSKGTSVNLGTR